jgi:arsenite methyltransferase
VTPTSPRALTRCSTFRRGGSACVVVGYPAEQLDCLPAEATESFAGVGYPFAADVIRQGNTVLDIGSGSGTDALIAAMLTAKNGVVYGLRHDAGDAADAGMQT